MKKQPLYGLFLAFASFNNKSPLQSHSSRFCSLSLLVSSSSPRFLSLGCLGEEIPAFSNENPSKCSSLQNGVFGLLLLQRLQSLLFIWRFDSPFLLNFPSWLSDDATRETRETRGKAFFLRKAKVNEFPLGELSCWRVLSVATIMAKLLKEDRVGGEQQQQQIFLVNNEIELGNFFRRKTLLDDNSQIFFRAAEETGRGGETFYLVIMSRIVSSYSFSKTTTKKGYC